MAENKVPTYQHTLQIVQQQGRDESWLKDGITRIQGDYGGGVEVSLAAWLWARENGIAVPEIAMRGGNQEGTPIALSAFTEQLVRAELELDRKERTLFAIEGVIISVKHGQTRGDPGEGKEPKDKVDIVLGDATGTAPVAFYGDAVAIFTNAGVKEGDYVRLPLVSVNGVEFPPKPPRNEAYFWKTFSVPPFEGSAVIPTQGDLSKVFKDPTKAAMKEGTLVEVRGVLTKLDKDAHDACSTCGRWVFDDKPEQHNDCGQYETVEQVSYQGTVCALNGQPFKVSWNHRQGKPKLKEMDRVAIRGRWKKTGGVAVLSAERIGGPRTQSPAASTPPVPVLRTTSTESAKHQVTMQVTVPPQHESSAAPPTPPAPPQNVPPQPIAVSAGVPANFAKHVEDMTKGLGGSNRAVLLANQAIERKLIPGLPADRNDARTVLLGHIEAMVTTGTLEWTDESKKSVRWKGN